MKATAQRKAAPGANLQSKPALAQKRSQSKSGVLKVQSILVPVDFSECSNKALAYAVSFARTFGATLTLLHVVEPVASPDFMASFPLIAQDAEIRAACKLHLERLIREESIEPALVKKVIVRTGPAFVEIAAAARRLRSDLVIIATHGHTGFARAVLGSTTERVVRHAPCPVLVVREHEHDFVPSVSGRPAAGPLKAFARTRRGDQLASPDSGRESGAFHIRNILVPLDFSACGRKSLRYAIPLAKEHGATLTLLYVVPVNFPIPEYGDIDFVSFQNQVHANSETHLARLAATEIEKSVSVKTVVRDGSPAREILDAARDSSADLIIISTHGHTGLKHLLLGSVAEHVVRRAPCPVLIVREREREFVSEKILS